MIADTVRSHPRPGSNSVGLLAFDTTQVTSPTNRSRVEPGAPCHPLAAQGHAPAIAFGGNNQAGPIDVATARNAHAGPHGRLDFETETFVVQPPTAFRVTGNDGAYETGDKVGALGTNTDRSAQAIVASGVRRLMPVETERLQGFPDGWTDIVHRGKPAADGPRYKAIGNSMAVPVLAWLLARITLQAIGG